MSQQAVKRGCGEPTILKVGCFEVSFDFWGLDEVWGNGESFEGFEAFPGIADVTLSHYHLQRTDECALLDSSIEERKAVRICRLKRVP
jgi:hypothetical protein